ncbi:DNA primase [Candidatus Marithrix sp. Canyon 246]|uniref:DNA primase n=1 Tax=Candidatus Marithrix sp. Canyon 246 TaxID=1827136 RepID=UPI00084A112D|nr:DNA primase [Candidatus Marithrix sp. Canyon 246]
MRIPRNFIDRLINRIDLVDLINSYISLRKTGINYTACCPFHNEKTPSFTVSAEKQFYYCFGCGVHGTAITFLIEYQHLTFVEAVHELASRLGIEMEYEQGSSVKSYDELYQLMIEASKFFKQQLRNSTKAINYLKTRGVSGEIARDFGLGYAPAEWDILLKTLGTTPEKRTNLLKTGLVKQNDSGRRYDRFRDRVMFPILDKRGRIIAFGGRTLNQNKEIPKYINSPETELFKKRHELYGWYLANKLHPLKNIIVVEGYMDVIALSQAGIKNVIAALGTTITEDHIKILFSRVSEIIFSFDGDKAGQKAAWRALETSLPLIHAGRQVNFLFLPSEHDPDSLIRKEGMQAFSTRLTRAIPLSNFLFDTLIQQVNLNIPEGQAALIKKAKALLTRLPKGPYQEQMWQKLKQITYQAPQKRRRNFKHFKQITSLRELSLVHQAIVCLLHKPALSQSIENPKQLYGLKDKDIKLLHGLIELTLNNPQLTLDAICEHWRDTEYAETINKLSAQKALFTEAQINIEKDFLGAINRLYKDYMAQRMKYLTHNITSLTAEEKQELKSLYKSRGQNSQYEN